MSTKRALIVSNSADHLRALRQSLESADWHVDEALDGAAAFSQARRMRPDFIIADLLIPVMDGDALLQHTKFDERLRPVPFVVVTDISLSRSEEALLLRLGAEAVVL